MKKVMVFMDEPENCFKCIFFDDSSGICTLLRKSISNGGIRDERICPMYSMNMHRMDMILKAVKAPTF